MKLLLQLLDARGAVRASVPIESAETILGRDLVAKLGAGADPSVSRRHARLVCGSADAHVEDLESRNGTRVNGVRVDGATRVRPGDEIELGEQRFRIAADAVIEERPAMMLYEGATLASTRAGAPERLRLLCELAPIAARRASASEILGRLHTLLERSLHPRLIASWTLGADAPFAGKADGAIFATELMLERVLRGGQVLRTPGGDGPAIAVAVPVGLTPEPRGLVFIEAHEARPLTLDDVSFVLAAAALAADALSRAEHERHLTMTPTAPNGDEDDEIVGDSPALKRAKREVDLVAPHGDLSVLLIGETGTGKELFARRVHHKSGRAGPFVPVNMAALPADLLESELFGHVKGAFTGATQHRTGYVEHASGGTLFLDEIGEMPAALQAKLLRMLQEKKMNRLGDVRALEVDVRIVGATNASLPQKIQAGAFREDLYYRLAGKEIRLPPLRDRAGDIGRLANVLLERVRANLGDRALRFGEDALAALSRYAWPGNVRQLESTVRLAAIHAAADGAAEIDVDHLDERVRISADAPPLTSQGGANAMSFIEELAAAERAIVVKALRAARGNKREAARLLGFSINTLRDRLLRYSIRDDEVA
jgi:DNA-binding NtrC family response regulator